MQAQMEIMGHEATLLSESDCRDSSEVELIPVDGELRWDTRGACGILLPGPRMTHSEFKAPSI